MLLHLGCGCKDYHSAMQEYHNGGALAALNAPALVKSPHILCSLYNCSAIAMDLMAPMRWQPIPLQIPTMFNSWPFGPGFVQVVY